MKRVLYNILTIVTLCTAMSCTMRLPIDESLIEPMLVVNAIVTPGEHISVEVRRSIPIFANGNPDTSYVADARVRVFINDTEREPALPVSIGGSNLLYVSQTFCTYGDRVRIEVSAPGFARTASGQTDVPRPVEIESVEYEPNGNADGTAIVGFTDPSERNYYLLAVRASFLATYGYGPVSDDNWVAMDYYYDYSAVAPSLSSTQLGTLFDPDYQDPSTTNSTGYFFVDTSFAGTKHYPAKVALKCPYKDIGNIKNSNADVDIQANLWTMDEHFGLYELSLVGWTGDVSSILEPHQIYTNISGGMGLVGSYAVSRMSKPRTTEI